VCQLRVGLDAFGDDRHAKPCGDGPESPDQHFGGGIMPQIRDGAGVEGGVKRTAMRRVRSSVSLAR
jgi:hypothetical protein